jgi:hypothetical protein
MRDQTLSSKEKLILFAIIDADPCYLTINGFFERTGIPKRTVDKVLSNLGKRKLIKRIKLNKRRCFTVSVYQDSFSRPSLPKESGLYFKKMDHAKMALLDHAKNSLDHATQARMITPNQHMDHATQAHYRDPVIETPYKESIVSQKSSLPTVTTGSGDADKSVDSDFSNGYDLAKNILNSIVGNTEPDKRSQYEKVFERKAEEELI